MKNEETGRAAPPSPIKHPRLLRCFRGTVKLYFLGVLALWLLLYLGADRWWPATLLLFGPRWVFALPLIILVPLAFLFERRQLAWLSFAAAILFVPFMGLCVPQSGAALDGTVIRVMTCNVGGPDLDRDKLARLIRASGADIVALQECPKDTAVNVFPGWEMVHRERLAVAAHNPITPGISRKIIHPPSQWPRASALQVIIHCPEGDISFSSIHLPSPRSGLSNMLDRDTFLSLSRLHILRKETELRRRTAEEMESLLRPQTLSSIIAGDFNMPVESTWYRRFWPEYTNAFSLAGSGYGLTEKIAVRGFEYKVRIDHILTRGEDLRPEKSWVGMDVGSDHLPLFAEIRRTESHAPTPIRGVP